MKEINDLNMIRSQVRSNIGKDVIVEADKGRNKIVTNKGTISQVFPKQCVPFQNRSTNSMHRQL